MELSSIILDNMKKVPRPLNCFMTYRLEKQREILEQCPGANHRDISKITAKWWKNMTFAEKEPYRRKAEQAKNEHERLYPDYKFTPKKKVLKTRVYKKRSESEYTSEDLKQRQQLAILYHHGMSAVSSTKTNYTVPADKREHRLYISSIESHHNYNNIEAPNANSNCISRVSHSVSLPNVAKLSSLRPRPETIVIDNRSTRPPPYAIPSHSIAPSPSPSISSSHSSSLRDFPVLGKVEGTSFEDVFNSSNRFYGSTNLLQEPPSDPFDSPYSNCSKLSISSDFNNHSSQSASSVALPLFNHFRHHLQHEGDTNGVYNIEKKGTYDIAKGHTNIDRHHSLFHPMTKTTQSHLPIYHPSTQY